MISKRTRDGLSGDKPAADQYCAHLYDWPQPSNNRETPHCIHDLRSRGVSARAENFFAASRNHDKI
jgi:hypothetical protein